MGGKGSVFSHAFPDYDKSLIIDNIISIAVQVNGKVRGSIDVNKNIDKDEIICLAKKQSNVSLHLNDKSIIKEILVPGRLVNFVVK